MRTSLRTNRIPHLLLLLTLLLSLCLVGCAERNGPAERLGENIDDAVEDAGNAMEEAADEVENAVDGGGMASLELVVPYAAPAGASSLA